MPCGLDVDALLGGLQKELDKAKTEALNMVNSAIGEAEAAANKLKEDMEKQIRDWMPKMPELPELPKIPMQIAMAQKAMLIAKEMEKLAGGNIPPEVRAAAMKKIKEIKESFKKEWGDALDENGFDMEEIFKQIEALKDLDPCMLIPNIKKDPATGKAKLEVETPVFPTKLPEAEEPSKPSASAEKSKEAIESTDLIVAANVTAVAKEVESAPDDTTIKEARSSKTPSGNKQIKGASVIYDASGKEVTYTGVDLFYEFLVENPNVKREDFKHAWKYNRAKWDTLDESTIIKYQSRFDAKISGNNYKIGTLFQDNISYKTYDRGKYVRSMRGVEDKDLILNYDLKSHIKQIEEKLGVVYVSTVQFPIEMALYSRLGTYTGIEKMMTPFSWKSNEFAWKEPAYTIEYDKASIRFRYK
jgi:hypothetical protein